jgi:hypothetical protein
MQKMQREVGDRFKALEYPAFPPELEPPRLLIQLPRERTEYRARSAWFSQPA